MDESVSAGTGSWIVNFKEAPKVKVADLKKALGRYKLDKVNLKVTTKVTEKEGKYFSGEALLANSKEKDAEDWLAQLKGKKDPVILYGILTEDDKGKQTLTLTRVREVEK